MHGPKNQKVTDVVDL